MRKARIHTDLALGQRAAWTIALLDPFIEYPVDWEDDFHDHAHSGADAFELTGLDDCDAAVVPSPWEVVIQDPALHSDCKRFVETAREADKRAIVFVDDIDDLEVDAPATTVYKMSLHRSRRRANERAQPAWIDDLAARFGDHGVDEKRERPVVGFCGFSPSHANLRSRVHHAFTRSPLAAPLKLNRGMHARDSALRALSRSGDVRTNFVFQTSGAGSIGPWASPFERRAQYVDVTQQSDYVLCARGWANFSFRLYETLCLGRIPLFVDTDCVLPLEDEIDWRSLCVWVDETDVNSIAERVAADYASMDAETLAERRRACRAAWEQHLTPAAFFGHLHDEWARSTPT